MTRIPNFKTKKSPHTKPVYEDKFKNNPFTKFLRNPKSQEEVEEDDTPSRSTRQAG